MLMHRKGRGSAPPVALCAAVNGPGGAEPRPYRDAEMQNSSGKRSLMYGLITAGPGRN